MRRVFMFLNKILIFSIVFFIFFFPYPADAQTAQEWVNYGDIVYSQGDQEKALQYYDAALAIDPYYIPALLKKGHVFYWQKRYDEAFYYYNAVLKIDPDNSEVELYISYVTTGKAHESLQELTPYYKKAKELHKEGNDEEALKYFDKCVEAGPEETERDLYVNSCYYKGTILIDQGRLEEAIECFDKALVFYPASDFSYIQKEDYYCTWKEVSVSRIWYTKAVCLAELKRYDEAIEYYKLLISLYPWDREKYEKKIQEVLDKKNGNNFQY